jgi:hypothetical protein
VNESLRRDCGRDFHLHNENATSAVTQSMSIDSIEAVIVWVWSRLETNRKCVMKITILSAELIDSLPQIHIPRPKKFDPQLSASFGHRPLISPFATIARFQGCQVDNHRCPLPGGKFFASSAWGLQPATFRHEGL